jgi:glutamyl-Q tRNA(Asp) synthetase
MILWQSSHHELYQEALRDLVRQGLVFSCGCSRRMLPSGVPYPGTCRDNRPSPDELPVKDQALRLVMPESIIFEDAVQGRQTVSPARDIGDIIIWRRDQLVSYSLACAIDDATTCSQVVRGADLLPNTAAQVAIMRYLSLPVPAYAHIPVATDKNNDKLSKHSNASPIISMDPVLTLQRAWRFLGQLAFPADSVVTFWSGAVSIWDSSRIPKRLRAFENGE